MLRHRAQTPVIHHKVEITVADTRCVELDEDILWAREENVSVYHKPVELVKVAWHSPKTRRIVQHVLPRENLMQLGEYQSQVQAPS